MPGEYISRARDGAGVVWMAMQRGKLRIAIITFAVSTLIAVLLAAGFGVENRKAEAYYGTGSAVVAEARAYTGMAYVWNGRGIWGSDCSDLVVNAYSGGAGIYLPDDPVALYGYGYTPYDLQPGDILFYATGGWGIDHVGIYTGNGQVIDANSYWGYVIEHDMYSVPGYVGAKRIL